MTEGASRIQFIGTFGLVSHAHRLSVAAIELYERSLYWEAQPVIRSAYEHSLTAAWVAQYPDAATAFVKNGEKKRQTAVRAAVRAGFGEADASDTPDLSHIVSPLESVAGNFEQICNGLAPGGAAAYTIYRVLCSYSHAGPVLVDNYIEKKDASLSAEPKAMGTPETWMFLVCAGLVWAGSAMDSLEMARPRAAELSRVARDLNIEPLLRAVT